MTVRGGDYIYTITTKPDDMDNRRNIVISNDALRFFEYDSGDEFSMYARPEGAASFGVLRYVGSAGVEDLLTYETLSVSLHETASPKPDDEPVVLLRFAVTRRKTESGIIELRLKLQGEAALDEALIYRFGNRHVLDSALIESSVATVVRDNAAPLWGFRFQGAFLLDADRIQNFTKRELLSDFAVGASAALFVRPAVARPTYQAIPFPPSARDKRSIAYNIGSSSNIERDGISRSVDPDQQFDGWEARYTPGIYDIIEVRYRRTATWGRGSDGVSTVNLAFNELRARMSSAERTRFADASKFKGILEIVSSSISPRSTRVTVRGPSISSDGQKIQFQIVGQGQTKAATVDITYKFFWDAGEIQQYRNLVKYASGNVSSKRSAPVIALAYQDTTAEQNRVQAAVRRFNDFLYDQITVALKPSGRKDKLLRLLPGSIIGFRAGGYALQCLLRRVAWAVSQSQTVVTLQLLAISPLGQAAPVDNYVRLGLHGDYIDFLGDYLTLGPPPGYLLLAGRLVTFDGEYLELYS